MNSSTPSAGWECPHCQAHNFGSRPGCLRCGAPRPSPQPAPVAETVPHPEPPPIILSQQPVKLPPEKPPDVQQQQPAEPLQTFSSPAARVSTPPPAVSPGAAATNQRDRSPSIPPLTAPKSKQRSILSRLIWGLGCTGVILLAVVCIAGAVYAYTQPAVVWDLLTSIGFNGPPGVTSPTSINQAPPAQVPATKATPPGSAQRPVTLTPLPTQIVPTATPVGNKIQVENVTLWLDPRLGSGAHIEVVPEGSGGFAEPRYLWIEIIGYPAADTTFTPSLYIYPAQEYAQLSEEVTRQMAEMIQLKLTQINPGEASLPFLPIINAAQLFHARLEFINFIDGEGFRYLTQFVQAEWPITNHDLIYTYQGLTSNGAYYVVAILPVSHPLLSADGSDIVGNDFQAFSNRFQQYLSQAVADLEGYKDREFTPNLQVIDNLIADLQIK